MKYFWKYDYQPRSSCAVWSKEWILQKNPIVSMQTVAHNPKQYFLEPNENILRSHVLANIDIQFIVEIFSKYFLCAFYRSEISWCLLPNKISSMLVFGIYVILDLKTYRNPTPSMQHYSIIIIIMLGSKPLVKELCNYVFVS